MSILCDNEQLITQKINQRKQELIAVLARCYDSETNELFDIDPNETYSLRELCEKTTRIQSTTNNQAPYPPTPNPYNSNTLYGRELNIHNIIQYCNNLLRYTLKKNGIEFNDCNIMEYLIKYIGTIKSFQKLDLYITDIKLLTTGDLEITYENYLNRQTTMVTNISDIEEDGNFTITKNAFSKNNIAYYYFSLNKSTKNIIAKSYTLQKDFFVAHNQEELIGLLETIHDGQTIFISNGTYTLSKTYEVPNCNIVGESEGQVIIKNRGFIFNSNSNTQAEVCNIVFDGNNVNRGDPGFIQCDVEANVSIYNCQFINMKGQDSCHAIRISKTSPSYSIEIYNCSFEGTNATTSGLTCASIAGYHISKFYNLSIHDNVFNHSTGGTTPFFGKTKAINLFNNNTIATTQNCKAYCNQYLGPEDSNVGITEQECP